MLVYNLFTILIQNRFFLEIIFENYKNVFKSKKRCTHHISTDSADVPTFCLRSFFFIPNRLDKYVKVANLIQNIR